MWGVARPEVRNLRLHPTGFHRLSSVSLDIVPGAHALTLARRRALRPASRADWARVARRRILVLEMARDSRGTSRDPVPEPMPSIAETVTELIQWVFPEHAGAPGQIHGGRMMQWICQAGTMAASRVARGTVVLGALDDIDFLHPVKVGQIAILRAQVEYVGTSSLEVGVRVWGEDVITGQRTVTLNSHLVFVSVDEDAKPRPVAARIEPRDAARGRAGRGGAAAPPAAPGALRGSRRPAPRRRGRRRRGRRVAVRVVALGAAGGRALRQHDVSRARC